VLEVSRLVITDGAWGTELQKLGLAPGELADLWNLTRPDDVAAVPRAYVAAGSRVILTNTFRANPIALAAHGLAEKTVEINRRGVAISRAAAAAAGVEGVNVVASIGPAGKMLAAGEIAADAVSAAFRLQAEAQAEAGADALLLETFSDLEEARLALQVARATGLPVIVSFAFVFDSGTNQCRTSTGATPEQAARLAAEEGAAAVGANCGAGPAGFAALCRRLKGASQLPVWIKPSAGLPTVESGRAVYAIAPEAFARFLPDLIQAGATFVGGCCGTNPEFIQVLVRTAASCACS
jgi:methionine synthase I (cobalamin-dependent)